MNLFSKGVEAHLVELNQKKAFNIFRLSWDIEQHLSSFLMYTDFLMKGIGCEKDISRAAAEIIEAYRTTKHPRLLHQLALAMELLGEFTVSLKILDRGVLSNSPECIHDFARYIKEGIGIHADVSKARLLFETNVNTNDFIDSQVEIAFMDRDINQIRNLWLNYDNDKAFCYYMNHLMKIGREKDAKDIVMEQWEERRNIHSLWYCGKLTEDKSYFQIGWDHFRDEKCLLELQETKTS